MLISLTCAVGMWPGAPAAPLAGQRADAPERDLMLGSPNSQVAFFKIATVEVDARGRILVLDEGNRRVQVFDASGAWVGGYGREGSGPGEFQAPAGMALTENGTAVFDLRLQRLTYFDSIGQVIATHGTRLSAAEHGWLHRMERLPSGNFVAELRTGCGYPRRPERDGRLRIVLLDREAALLDTLVSTVRRDRLPYYGDLGGSGFCTALRAPYPHLLLWDVAPDGSLAMADGARYSIEIRDPAGTVQHRIQRDVRPVRLTAADRERYRLGLARPELEPAERRYIEGYLEEVDYPDHLPVIDALRFDHAGRLWVRRAPSPGDSTAVWDAFDRRGGHAGSARIPAAADIMAITAEGFVGVLIDPDLEVPQIVRYAWGRR